jgi:hypothetical protein
MSATLYVVHDDDPADREWAVHVANLLRAALIRQPHLPELPVVQAVAGFLAMPASDEIDEGSLVLLVLPRAGRTFAPPEVARIEPYRDDPGNRSQLLPVAPEPARNVPPAPIEGVVSFKLHNADDPEQIERLTTCMLNQVFLRVPHERRSLFVSYRATDGRAAAEILGDSLAARGYSVWRDERTDADNLPYLTPGGSAQDEIRQAIGRHDLLLLIDTPDVLSSTWVKEEVDMALGLVLPIVPVVLEGPPGTPNADAGTGGRFRALQELDVEVRLPRPAGPRALVSADARNVLDMAFLDRLSATIDEALRSHLETRQKLTRATKRRFERLFPTKLSWHAVPAHPDLFTAEVDMARPKPPTPELCLRLLVLCSPYRAVPSRIVRSIADLTRQQEKHCQYGILMCSTSQSIDRLDLVHGYGHILLFQPGDLEQLAAALTLPDDRA